MKNLFCFLLLSLISADIIHADSEPLLIGVTLCDHELGNIAPQSNPPPIVAIIGESELCIGETSQLSPSTGGTWSSSNVGVLSVDNTGLVTAIATGFATFTFVEDITGSSATTEAIIVNSTPVVSVGTNEICINEVTDLFPNANFGSWVALNPATAVLLGNGFTVNGISAGTAGFIYTENSTGCLGDTIFVTVDPGPATSITGDDEICVNETSQLSPGTGGVWSSSDPAVATVNNAGFVVGVSPGTASFTYSDVSNGCQSLPSDPITVLATPIVEITGPDEICIGETTTVTPNTGGTWVSSNSTVLTVNNAGIATGVGPGVATLTFTDSSTGCTSNETDPITVYPVPTVSFTGPDTVCVGGTTTLSPTTGGVWTSTEPGVAQVTNAGQVTAVGAGTAFLKFGQTGSDCFSDSLRLVVLEADEVSIAGDAEICVGGTAQLSPSVGGTWITDNPSIAAVNNAGFILCFSPGTTLAYFTNFDGCQSTPLEVTCFTVPTTLYVGPPDICVGQESQILPSSGGTWVSNNTSVATITADGFITGTGEGTVDFTFTTDQQGCSATSETMYVTGGVTIEDLGYSNLCVEQWTQFFANVQGGQWTTDDPSIAVIDPNGVLTGVSLGDVKVRYTLADGCSDEVEVTMVKSDAGPDQVIQCLDMNNGTYLQADGIGSWSLIGGSGTATIADPNNPSTLVSNFSDEGEFLFEWTTVDGCQDYVSVIVRENCACFFVDNLIDPPMSNTLCVDDIISLSMWNDNNSVTSYVWQLDRGDGSFTNAEEINDSPVLETSPADLGLSGEQIFIRGLYHTDNDCVDTSNVIRLFIEEEVVTNPILGTTNYCLGDTIRLSTEATTDCQYIWVGPAGFTATGNSIEAPISTYAAAGEWSLQARCGNCSGNEESIDITVSPISEAPILADYNLCIGETTDIFDPTGLITLYISSNPGVATVENGVVTAVDAGQVVFYATSPGDPCISAPSDTLFVGSTNGASIAITGPDEICIGESTTLSPTSGGTWTSANTAVATVSTAGIVTGVSAGSTTFYFEPSSGTCQGSSTDPITVYDCSEPCHPLVSTTTISGQAYIDENENGIFDIGETPLNNVMITALETGDMVLTGLDGIYELILPIGTYSIKADIDLGSWEQTEVTLINIGQNEPCVDGVDFGFIQTPAPPSMVLSLASAINRCDEVVKFTLWFENTGSEPLSGTVRVVFDTLTEYAGFLDLNAELVENVVTWSYSDLQPFVNNRLLFWLEMPPLDDPFPQLDYYVEFLDTEGNVVASDELHTELKCAVDPNDKQMKPNRGGEENYLLPGEELEYTVRFQNNGNDTAFLVTIVDVLDENIDARSVSVVGSSHPVKTAIQGQTVTFTFDDILLVDSLTNVEESQGYVSFRCKILSSLEEGVEIRNQADIVFGQNPPIITNEVLNTFVEDLCFGPLQGDETKIICDGDAYLGHAETGIYLDTLTSVYGCDSVNIVDLTVEALTASSFDAMICDGESLVFNNMEYTAEGQYADTIYTVNGCPQTAYNIIIQQYETVELTIDTSICPGEDYQGYTEAGSYTVDVPGESGCDSIYTINLAVLDANDSNCLTATDEYNSRISVFPNPSNGVFTITSATPVVKISMVAANGGSVNDPESIYSAGKVNVKTNGLPSGIYILAIHTARDIFYKRIVIN